MAASYEPINVAFLNWQNRAVNLRDFAKYYGVPNVAKVVEGQYKDIGSTASGKNAQLYIHSIDRSEKVLAEGVKVKEGRGKASTSSRGQKYSLPITYEGWFELLSQDGKAVKAISSVSELTKLFPAKCIVREKISVFQAGENGETLSREKMRILVGGEELYLIGETWITMKSSGNFMKQSFLHCRDINGQGVYLPMDHKGLFSPVAGQTNISGVHTLAGLIEKFRFPILVRLVHGIIPSKLEKNFSGLFRLNGVYSEESLFVSTLKKDSKLLPISTRESMKLVGISNLDEITRTAAYSYHVNRCRRMMNSYLNSIHLLFTMPDPNYIKSEKKEIAAHISHAKSEEDLLFAEVEDIYAYVREGGPTPPPPREHPETTPTTTITSPHKFTTNAAADGEFWEEAIYEAMDRIRFNKRQDLLNEDNNIVETPFPNEQTIEKPAAASKLAPPPPPRQQGTEQIDQLKDMLEDISAPPIPPKMFASVNDDRSSDTPPSGPNSYVNQLRTLRTAVEPIIEPRRQLSKVNDEDDDNVSNTWLRLHNTGQHKITKSFVAIARVGDNSTHDVYRPSNKK